MFTLELDIETVIDAVDGIPAALDRQQPQLLGEIGRRMGDRLHEDFLTKALGGRGDDGVKWADVTPAEARRKQRLGRPLIGVRSGVMGARSNIRALVTNEAVFIDFADQPKVRYFNVDRSLIPARVPAPWRQEAEDIAQRHFDQVAESQFPE